MGKSIIQYGYENFPKAFIIATDFENCDYYYLEQEQDFLFRRQWGKLNPREAKSQVCYKNLMYRGILNRHDYWSLYIESKTRGLIIFEKKKNRIYHYGILKPTIDMDDNYVDISDNNIKVKHAKQNKAIIKTQISNLVAEVIKKHKVLYNQIKGKEIFSDELEDYYLDLIDAPQTDKDIQSYINESEKLFLNYLNSEQLFSNINEDEIFDNFLYAVDILGREKIKEILSDYEYEVARLDEFTKEDLFCELKRKIDCLIERSVLKKKLEAFDVKYILNRYKSKVEKISNQEDFIKELTKEMEFCKSHSTTEADFFVNIKEFIFLYTRKDAFISKYGSNNVRILLSDERKALFDNLPLEEIPENDLREYELYHELEKTRNVEMYCKDGKTLKPSFRAIPTFISNFQKIIKTATEYNLIQWNGEEYEFVSIDQLQAFGKKLK